MDENNRLEKIFPDYFEKFELPSGAHEEEIKAYRACATGECDEMSFIPSFEENGYQYLEDDDPKDPSVYSLSLFEKPKDVKRFASMTSEFQVPYKIALGITASECGLVQRTRERTRKRTSHIDWWLYLGAMPHKYFELIPDFENYLTLYTANQTKGGI